MTFVPDPNPLGLTPDFLGTLIGTVAYCHDFKVNDEASFNSSTELRDTLHATRKVIEAAREHAKRPFIDEGRRIDALANVMFNQILPVVQYLDAARFKFRDSCMNPTVVTEPTPSDISGVGHPPDLSATVQVAPASVPKMRTRTTLTLEILDPSLIPREYLDVNEARVRAALLAGTPVPGARLLRKETSL